MRLLSNLLALLLLFACAPPEPEPEPEPEPCVYPEPSEPFAGIGDVIPPLKWRGYEDHQRVDVDLEAFHCGELWPEFDALLFVLVAEWCPECPEYSELVGRFAEEIEFAGTKIIFVDMETRSFTLPTSESADNYVSLHTEVGVRVGEGDGDPAGFIAGAEDAGLWRATPNAFFVRKSDMQIVTRQQDGTLILPFVQIAQGIELDWSDPDNPPFVDNCSVDEDSEPNDDVAQAALLSPGDVFEGGICDPAPDLYRVEVQGSWRLELEFTHLIANLDVLLVDDEGEVRTFPNGSPMGAASRDDDETLVGSGPALVMVRAPMGRSAPYTLRFFEQ